MTSNNRSRILVVDDSPSTLSMVQTALEEAGYRVSAATTGEKAIRRACLVIPDLILLDIVMPQMDGYEICRRLKAEAATRDIPIIFLSGMTETFDKVKGFSLGAVDYLIKPIATEELLARVRTHVTLASLRKELETANQYLEERVALRTEELSQERILLRTVIDHVPDAIFVKDLQGRKLLTNRADLDCLGAKAEADVIGKTDWELFPKSTAAQLAADDQAVIATGRPLLDQEQLLINRSDQSRWFLLSKLPLRDGNGELIGLVGIGHDITERKQAEAAKSKLELQVRQVQKLEALGTLAGGIAHDFNNILTPIMSYSELARMDAGDNPNLLGSLDQVRQAGQRAKELVRQILAFSRQTKPERKLMRLDGVVREALSLLRCSLPTTIEIRTRIEANTPVVMADSTQVHQVLLNLGTNAAYAMRGQPGLLTVELSPHTVTAQAARASAELQPGLHARLLVRDSGCGMDGETLKRLFDPFFTTKPPGEGTGLGLAVVHGIMKDHQGAILVESQPGLGTTFELFFPAFQGQEVTEGIVVEPSHGHGERLLFVDDETAICLVARKALERFGYQVTTFDQPQKAFDGFRLQPQAVDLVITDLTMPTMTGIELAVKMLKIRPDLPVILTSGYSGVVTSEMASSVGICDVLPKPITPVTLGETVYRVLTNRPRPPVIGQAAAEVKAAVENT